MRYVGAKLFKDDIGKHRQYRTLFKDDVSEADIDDLVAIAAKRLPADTSELDVIVNGPTFYIYPIIILCQLREITLTLILRTSKDWEDTTRLTILRFWTCPRCDGRYSVAHATCPYCGGLGYHLALPDHYKDYDEQTDNDDE